MGMGSSTQFNSSTTAVEALDGTDLSGRVAIVTGGNAGIGRQIVKTLSLAKATVVIACRSIQRGETAKSEILGELERKEDDPNCPIHVLPLDLNDLETVRDFAQKFDELDLYLNFVVCNAGVFPNEYKTTKQGFEWNLGINHLGHFYLINLLLPKLKLGKEQSGQSSRVICLSSSMKNGVANGAFGDQWINNRFQMGDDVIGNKEAEFVSTSNYSQGKLFVELAAREFNKRFYAQGVMGVSARPGLVMTNMTANDAPWIVKVLISVFGNWIAKTPEQGAATMVRVCVIPENEMVPGGAYADCNIEPGCLVTNGANEESYEYKMWEISTKLIAKAGFDLPTY